VRLGENGHLPKGQAMRKASDSERSLLEGREGGKSSTGRRLSTLMEV